MNKTELTEAVAEAADLSKASAGRTVDAVIAAITGALKSGDQVAIAGFGTFLVRARGARTGRNPRTGEPMEIESLYYGDDRVIEGAFSVKAFPLPNNCVGVTFENITKRKKAEDEIKHLNLGLEQHVIERTKELRKLSEAVIHNPTSVVITNPKGKIEYINPKFTKVTGYTIDEVIDQNRGMILPPTRRLLGCEGYNFDQHCCIDLVERTSDRAPIVVPT